MRAKSTDLRPCPAQQRPPDQRGRVPHRIAHMAHTAHVSTSPAATRSVKSLRAGQVSHAGEPYPAKRAVLVVGKDDASIPVQLAEVGAALLGVLPVAGEHLGQVADRLVLSEPQPQVPVL